MTIADFIILELARHGIGYVFGYIGARNIATIEAVYNNPDTVFVNMYHEASAAFAACAYAQISGGLGVAVSTSGPGATNMLTGIANAYCDSIPALFITGQVSGKGLRGNRKIRNNETQEVDIVAMAKPVAKYAVQVTDKSRIRYELEKCIAVALDGRQGPTLLDLPEDMQFQKIDPDELEPYVFQPSIYDILKENMETLEFWIAQSKRPILLVGNGARTIAEQISRLCAKVPVVASLAAPDICDNSLENYMGVAGNNGLRCANLSLTNADLIISLGCSFTAKYTGQDKSKFAVEAKIVRIDIDAEELNARTIKDDELKICCDLRQFVDKYGTLLEKLEPSAEWIAVTQRYKSKYFCENRTNTNTPYDIMFALTDYDIVIADVGSHEFWAIQSLQFAKGQLMLNSSGLSSMGYALPASIGAHYAAFDKKVVCIVGDGGLQMTIQELQLIVRENLPITVIIMNNGVLGLIKQFQKSYYDENYVASVKDYSVPDFEAIARAYGISAATVKSTEEFKNALNLPLPKVINVIVDPEFDIRPRIIQRRAIEDQFPFLSDEELAEDMIVPYERKSI